MKLIRFSGSNDVESYGILNESQVVSLPILSKANGKPLPPSLEALISQGVVENEIERIVQSTTKGRLKNATVNRNELRLLKPISSPSKIICLGLNYKDHAEEQRLDPPDEPVIFFKPRTAIIGPEENIIKPRFVKKLDYEAELAIIIGKESKNTPVRDAHSAIFGYTILNDVSARDIQFKDKQWTRGKSFDTFAPLGPCVTCAKQIKNPDNLQIRARVNGELRQNASTDNMFLNVSEIIHHLSRVMTLEPCDIIATGTPAGVGFAMKPPRFLGNGDIVEVEIEGIGVLRNRVEYMRKSKQRSMKMDKLKA